MDLNLDKLIGDLHEGTENVIRGHFSTIVPTLEADAAATAEPIVAEVAHDLERVIDKLKQALQPPAPAKVEAPTGDAQTDAPHNEVVGQPATS